MIQGEGKTADWGRIAKAEGGPNTDYSNMGKCTGENYCARTWCSQLHSSASKVYLFICFKSVSETYAYTYTACLKIQLKYNSG